MSSASLPSGLLVIFGITGDLAHKKLLPALYHLCKDHLLPEHFEIIGITRRGTTVDDLLAGIKKQLDDQPEGCDPAALQRLGAMMRIVKMDMSAAADYHELKTTLDAIEDQHGACLSRLFYLSIPPQVYGPVVDMLGESKLNSGCQHGSADSRIMVEKPFGYDLASAEELIVRLKRSFSEQQIYRIDHYLAKETAQNILTFRFANPVFEAVWDNRSVESITITASETIGIEGRAVFYEPIGALRDFIQSHLLQLLTLITMEEPPALTAGPIHAQKLKLLEAVTPIGPDEVAQMAVRGQYRGYRDEVSNPASTTETFARLTLSIDNDRWRDVPITLQTGKHLDRKSTEITLTFGDQRRHDTANTLTFRLQPNEGIDIDLLAKKPGFDNDTERVEMTFNYPHTHGADLHPDAYERVLMDGIRGDQTLFASSAEVLASWRIVEAVVQEWAKTGVGLAMYEPGARPAGIQPA